METFCREIPKAELHLHIEGTLEPELMLELGRRNGVRLPFASAEEAREAYQFTDLQSFLDIYYRGMAVLRTEDDFRELTVAYLDRSAAQGLRHVEPFFDPQAHAGRGVPLAAVIEGILRGLEEGRVRHGISAMPILCFLRHLSAEDAAATLQEALPWREHLVAVGLDSSELGHPPSKFTDVFARARELGLKTVAHAGEEGPPSYISGSLDLLGVSRIDHGVRCLEDPQLVKRLVEARVPLTVCPHSNVKLGVFDEMVQHNLKQLLEAGLLVTVNSDDPSYFGGYIGDNFVDVQRALGLDRDHVVQLARNSFEASFLDDAARQERLQELDAFVAASAT